MKSCGVHCLFLAVAAISVFASQAVAAEFPEVKDLPVQKEMSDVITMSDGTHVTTTAQWRVRLREMKEMLEHYELGHAPPPPGNVLGTGLGRLKK